VVHTGLVGPCGVARPGDVAPTLDKGCGVGATALCVVVTWWSSVAAQSCNNTREKKKVQ
jgi:hypothetical protein